MSGIYIESKTLLENKQAVKWLDGCGAVWALTRHTFMEFTDINDPFIEYKNGWGGFVQTNQPKSNATHTPTALKFCQELARIMGIPEPTFGEVTGHILTQNEIDKIIEFDKQKPFYPHKSYRILDSLDGVPLDTRIPLSEWIPPIGKKVLLVTKDWFMDGYFDRIESKIIFETGQGVKALNLDGHWMRIV